MSYDPYRPQQPQPPYQPSYPQQPGQWPAPPPLPQRKANWWVVIGSVIAIPVAVALFAAAAGNFAKRGSTRTASAAKSAEIGAATRDGKFQFTVKSVDCGHAKVGGEFLSKDAQGTFCLVTVNVANIGKEAQSFDGGAQKLFDSAGTQYSNDSGAEFYANDKNQTLFEEINPGNQVTGTLVFDVPKSAKPTSIELHDSMFSQGVTVSIK